MSTETITRETETVSEVIAAETEARIERIEADTEAAEKLIEAQAEADVARIEAQAEAQVAIIEAHNPTKEMEQWQSNLTTKVVELEQTVSTLSNQVSLLTLAASDLIRAYTERERTEAPPEPPVEISDAAVEPEALATNPPAPATPARKVRRERYL